MIKKNQKEYPICLKDIPNEVIDFFNEYPFCLMYSIGNRGAGKTLFLAIFGLFFNIIFPNRRINGNFHLNLPNFDYNPYSFFPYGKINNTYIALDDCKNLKSVSKIVDITANDSRKFNLYLILTTQYSKFVAKSLREMSEFYVEIELTKLKTINGKKRLTADSKMTVIFIDDNGNEYYWFIENPLELAELNLYNTDEKVLLPLDKYVVYEIVKCSNDFDDIMINLESYYSKTESVKLYKRLIKYSFRQIKILSELDIESLLYKIPKDILEKRKKESI